MKPIQKYPSLLANRILPCSLLVSAALCLVVFSTGCYLKRPKYYVDPQFRDARYSSITAAENPLPVYVTTVFLRNGKPYQKAQPFLHKYVTNIIGTTRVFTQTGGKDTTRLGRLEISVNDIFNKGEAIAKGIALGGFSIGSVGVDSYEMTAIYTPAGGTPITKKYKHAIHTAMGGHAAPEGMEHVTPDDVFARVVEDMFLNCLRDLQKEGSL